jgi:hypothetical protein
MAAGERAGRRGRPPRVLIDLTPLRRSRDLRCLVLGEMTSVLGTQLTTVAVPYQVYQLTRSSLAVGLVSVAQLFPLIAGRVPDLTAAPDRGRRPPARPAFGHRGAQFRARAPGHRGRLPDRHQRHGVRQAAGNGVREDYRPENLELWTRPQPTGIRVSDAVAWAREILTRYAGASDTSNSAQGSP